MSNAPAALAAIAPAPATPATPAKTLAADPDASLPPHPELSNYYHGHAGKRAFLKNVFDDSASDYDRVERVLALGSGRWYRRKTLVRAGLTKGMRVLDVATGTGLVAREALDLVGTGGRVVGVDPSVGMLAQARSLDNLRVVVGVGESLPVADATFDFVSMGYALRHLPDLRLAMGEFLRVLKPGGRLCILEISRPAGPAGRQLMAAYFKLVLPILVRTVSTQRNTGKLWRYYWDTIDQCVPPERVLSALRDVGFRNARRNVNLGMFSEFVAVKG